MGNFSICRAIHLELSPQNTRLTYVADFAEIPAIQEITRLDRNADGTIEEREKTVYLASLRAEIAKGVRAERMGKRLTGLPGSASLEILPGAAGLKTLRAQIEWNLGERANLGDRWEIEDRNFEGRTGWREIVVTGANGLGAEGAGILSESPSHLLRAYPANQPPLQASRASFHVTSGTTSRFQGGRAQPGSAAVAPAARSDAFTNTILANDLTPGVLAAGLLIAFLWGAMHALSPGHGKAMVAAYLVGARGTVQHAVVLGLTVTVTHTLGVFALGLLTLFASRYVVPETLYPVLSAVSGLAVLGVGVMLLVQRWRGRENGHHHHGHHHDHAHDEGHGSHSHHHHHEHAHGHHHHHVPEGPVTLGSLIALGVSGGIVPCPTALVVLLAAVALGRIAYGMALITAFSFGLAAVLVAIGMLVVLARGFLEKLPSSGRLTRALPVAGAAMVTLTGALLVARSLL